MMEKITLKEAIELFPTILDEMVQVGHKQDKPIQESSVAEFQFCGDGNYRTTRLKKKIAWTDEDDLEAKRQGWQIIFYPNPKVAEIRAVVNPVILADTRNEKYNGRIFQKNMEALAYVHGRADGGDAHAQKALEFIAK